MALGIHGLVGGVGVAMIRLLRNLFETPGAETDPADWATRFCAHQGLAALASLLALALMHANAAVALLLASYALWEGAQFIRQRGWLLWWDCVADWCAWTAMVLALAWWPVLCVAVSLALLAAGVWRRNGN